MLKLLLYGVQAEVVALLNEEYGFEYMEDVHWEDVLRGDMQVGQVASSGRCCSRECVSFCSGSCVCSGQLVQMSAAKHVCRVQVRAVTGQLQSAPECLEILHICHMSHRCKLPPIGRSGRP